LSASVSFSVRHRDPGSPARSGELVTAHGVVRTPAFVGVATQASIKAVEPRGLAAQKRGNDPCLGAF